MSVYLNRLRQYLPDVQRRPEIALAYDSIGRTTQRMSAKEKRRWNSIDRENTIAGLQLDTGETHAVVGPEQIEVTVARDQAVRDQAVIKTP